MSEQLTFIFDIDGTICPIKTKEQTYAELIPYSDMVQKMREYRAQGAKLVLYTSRNMNTFGGNIGLINANTAKVLLEWLDRWEIPYDEIIYGKPWPGHHGFYVDDRSVRPDEFLNYNVPELNNLCGGGRCQK